MLARMNHQSRTHTFAACRRHLRWVLASLALAIGVAPVECRAEDPVRFYPGRYLGDTADSAAAVGTVLRPGEAASGLVIRLSPAGGEIKGRLTGLVEGVSTPLDGVVVEARVGRFHAAVLTEHDGAFRLARIPAGRARVRYATDAPAGRWQEFLATWHPGVQDSSDALGFPLTDGRIIDLGTIRLGPSAVLSGSVFADDTAPLPNTPVRILLQESTSRRSWTTMTDAQGNWSQGGLFAGFYKVVAATEGTPYIPEYFGGARELGSARTISLADQERVDNVLLSPDSGGEITGQVLEENVGPLGGALVRAIRVSDRALYTTTTNSLGIYELIGLPGGSYFVHVPAIHTYYPDASIEREARAVRVTEPDETGGIDLTGRRETPCNLDPGTAGGISGTVTANFDGVTSAEVIAFSAQDTLRREITASGGYTLRCVPAGSYRVLFLAQGPLRRQYHAKVNSLEEATVVVVTPPDSALRVDFEPKRTVSLTGVVHDAGDGAPVAGARVWAREDTSGAVATALTDELGAFALEHLDDGSGLPAGRWIVRAESTLVAPQYPTPVLQPALAASAVGGEIDLWFELALDLEWQVILERRSGDGVVLVYEAERRPGGETRLTDRPEHPGSYRYRLSARPLGLEGGDWFVVESASVFLAARAELRVAPNPGTRGVPIRFELDGVAPRAAGTDLRIIAANGREVARLDWVPGAQVMTWDGRRADGALVPSGFYFYRLVAPGNTRLLAGSLVISR
ncbi:MAG: carboxypeptidase regulatory-like domain-containing protein [Candidatus Eisenbacteria bacterium]|nr:carboxypeptidase regulatory-like domain-containing protein [Candidatus Eisenbacteria bacterium]